jgi:hypothetical protein
MSDDSASPLAKVFMYAVLGLAINNPLWQDPKGAARTLEDAGYTPVSVGGYSWFNGSDAFKTKFTAINPHGKTINGTVTEGLIFKGSSIRFEP